MNECGGHSRASVVTGQEARKELPSHSRYDNGRTQCTQGHVLGHTRRTPRQTGCTYISIPCVRACMRARVCVCVCVCACHTHRIHCILSRQSSQVAGNHTHARTHAHNNDTHMYVCTLHIQRAPTHTSLKNRHTRAHTNSKRWLPITDSGTSLSDMVPNEAWNARAPLKSHNSALHSIDRHKRAQRAHYRPHPGQGLTQSRTLVTVQLT